MYIWCNFLKTDMINIWLIKSIEKGILLLISRETHFEVQYIIYVIVF